VFRDNVIELADNYPKSLKKLWIPKDLEHIDAAICCGDIVAKRISSAGQRV
jgi:hypothetical protein